MKPPENGVTILSDGTHYYLDGREVSEAEYRAVYAPAGVPAAGGWKKPLKSEALAVHPSQVAAANERNRRAGCSVTYAADGTAVVPDRGERKKLLKIEGFHDRDGGYGDG
jgi:hypothetical protein